MRETGASNKLSESGHDESVSLFDSTNQQTFTFKWRELRLTPEDTNDFPRCRSKHGACRLGDYVYMFGGKDVVVSLKDLWRYSLEKNKWESVSYSGEKLPHLETFSMLPHRRLIYIFGGEFSLSQDETPLWVYNTDLQYIRKITTQTGQPHPSGRRDHSAVIYEDAMYIYGGFTDVTGSSNELWKFSCESEEWQLVLSVPGGEDGPGARHGHTAVVYDKSMWVYGGMTDLTHKPELWTYSFKQQKWTRIRTRVNPPALIGHTADAVGDSMFVLGGENCGQPQSAMWRFHFESQNWERVDFPTGVLSSRTRHCTALILPPRLADSEKETTRSVSLPALQRRSRQSTGVPERPRTSPAGCSRPLQSSNTIVFNNKVYPNDSSSASSSLSSTPNDVKAVRELGKGCNGSSDRSEGIELSIFFSERGFMDTNDKEALLSTVHTLCDNHAEADNPAYMASPGVTGNFKVFDSSVVDKVTPGTPVVPLGHLVDVSIPTDYSPVNARNKLQLSAKTQHQHSEAVVKRKSFPTDDIVLEDLEQGATLSELFEQDELFLCSSKLSHSATISGQISNACQAVSGKLRQMSGAQQPAYVKLEKPVAEKLSQPSAETKTANKQGRKDDCLTERAMPVWKSRANNSEQTTSFSPVCAETRQRSHDNPVQRTASDACQKSSKRAPSYVLQDTACIYVFGGREGNRRELGKTPVSVFRCEIPLTS
ncbi:uncharacterized protein LOC135477737 [Liolophura sinensis]|uniref:uncharacterized protein LOC135477737 n=1 Tax=Liolophura sinensis TaxID=3198878 RepID=UPI00315807CC